MWRLLASICNTFLQLMRKIQESDINRKHQLEKEIEATRREEMCRRKHSKTFGYPDDSEKYG